MWALAERRPDAVVLGDLPSLSHTLGLLRELRGHQAGGRVGVDPDVPALVLSAAAGELCELRAFEAGADDFQPASVSYLVLRARLGALIARTRITRRAKRVAVGSLRIDTCRVEASYAGCPLELSRLEFALLHQLAREPERVFTKDELLAQVWGYPIDARASTRTLDAHAARLRRKLARAAHRARSRTGAASATASGCSTWSPTRRRRGRFRWRARVGRSTCSTSTAPTSTRGTTWASRGARAAARTPSRRPRRGSLTSALPASGREWSRCQGPGSCHAPSYVDPRFDSDRRRFPEHSSIFDPFWGQVQVDPGAAGGYGYAASGRRSSELSVPA
jgi:DNA-binding response OmpR family regulator